MYLQFLDLYGNPVYVRPERTDALRGIAVSWEGKPRAATLIVMTNRETFRVRGHVDTIKDAIEAWHAERTPKMMVGELASFEGCPEVIDCRHRASVNAIATFDINGNQLERCFKVATPAPRPSMSQFANNADYVAALDAWTNGLEGSN